MKLLAAAYLSKIAEKRCALLFWNALAALKGIVIRFLVRKYKVKFVYQHSKPRQRSVRLEWILAHFACCIKSQLPFTARA